LNAPLQEHASQDGKDVEQFSDGHTRRLSRLTRGPFRYKRYADFYLDVALRYAHVPVKRAVISDPMCNACWPEVVVRPSD
jgi:hypothetical protein